MPGLPDDVWMRRALAEAERGRGAVEPNPLVGAIVVNGDDLIAVGHHERFGGPHAEVVALDRSGEASRGATVFVTLEPCCHHGKTPPCTDALIRAGVARVVAAISDPFPKVAGGGIVRLEEAGIAVEMGVLEDEAKRLNAPYLKRLATGRPYVIAKWAMTLDGKIAARTGQSSWISGPRSRALVHEVRGRMDAIVVGIGTALADDPRLTARPAGSRVATRVVLDSEARLPTESRLVRTAREVPVLVATSEQAPADRVDRLVELGCRVSRFPSTASGSVPINALLSAMGEEGMTNILVEGGGRVLGSFFDAGAIDEVDIFLALMIEGGSHNFIPVRGMGVATVMKACRVTETAVTQVDADVRIRGRIYPPNPRGGSRA